MSTQPDIGVLGDVTEHVIDCFLADASADR
jgi:hypothetical protein